VQAPGRVARYEAIAGKGGKAKDGGVENVRSSGCAAWQVTCGWIPRFRRVDTGFTPISLDRAKLSGRVDLTHREIILRRLELGNAT
jgi:hypothetical protein